MIAGCPACGKQNRVAASGHGAPHCGSCGAPLPWIAEAGDADFHEVAEASDVPALVDFWAPWCAPCRMVSPALEQLANTLSGRMKLVKVNTDQAPGLSARFKVRSIPTLVFLDHGRETARTVGALRPSPLRQWVLSQLAPAPSR